MHDMTKDTPRRILFALPYAGGSSLSYMGWKFSDEITFIPLEYPGHGLRSREVLPNRLQDLALDAAHQIEEILNKEEGKVKFAVFGHSMGGVVAYHTLQYLKSEYGLVADAAFISSSAPPSLFPPPNMSEQSDEELLEYLHSGIGISEEKLKNPRFMKMYMPMLKNDDALILGYKQDCDEILEMPLFVFGAKQDEMILPEYLPGWEAFSKDGLQIEWFEGDHFYFKDDKNLEMLCKRMEEKWSSMS